MTKPADDREPAPAAITWQAVRDHLRREKDRIVAEIRAYPPPIAGCDAQYQYLTERRRLIAGELARLEAAAKRGDDGLDDFIRSSAFIDARTAEKMWAR